MTSWQPGWADFPPALLEFWTERHLCTLTTLRADGSPHVVPRRGRARRRAELRMVITFGTSRKAAQAAADGRIAACQVDGGRWSTIEGIAEVRSDQASVTRAMERYAARYRTPKPNPLRVALRIEVDRFLVSSGLV